MDNAPALAGRAYREKVLALEADVGAAPQLDVPVQHYFADGAYGRRIDAPAGAVLVGKIHKTAHICALLKGRVQVATETGPVEYAAPAVFVSPAGTKRAVVVLEDCTWLNFHPTGERDLAKIERRFIASDYNELARPLHNVLQRVVRWLGYR